MPMLGSVATADPMLARPGDPWDGLYGVQMQYV
jgi:hypothetical protein